MFYGSQFNQPIGDWDTSSVASMFAMFKKAQFNQPDILAKWNFTNDLKLIFTESALMEDIENDPFFWVKVFKS